LPCVDCPSLGAVASGDCAKLFGTDRRDCQKQQRSSQAGDCPNFRVSENGTVLSNTLQVV
jgi:hypothetical protein